MQQPSLAVRIFAGVAVAGGRGIGRIGRHALGGAKRNAECVVAEDMAGGGRLGHTHAAQAIAEQLRLHASRGAGDQLAQAIGGVHMDRIDPGAAVDLGALNQDLAVAALVVHLVVGLRGGGALFDQALDAAAAAVIAVLDGFSASIRGASQNPKNFQNSPRNALPYLMPIFQKSGFKRIPSGEQSAEHVLPDLNPGSACRILLTGNYQIRPFFSNIHRQ